MAFSLECKRCGRYEAQHDYPDDYPGVCVAYVSPDYGLEAQLWKAKRLNQTEYQTRKRRVSGIGDDL